MGDLSGIQSDLAQLVRLVIAEQYDDVRLYVARLVRKYRETMPALSEQLDLYLRNKPQKPAQGLRKATMPKPTQSQVMPVDEDSRLTLLKAPNEKITSKPLLSSQIEDSLDQIILERKHIDRLKTLGLQPTRSAIFVGPPGVGKTLTASWLAQKLGVPFYVLDLTAVMSSYLGKSGNNLRAALDFAKRGPCVLLLDEIDSIAKKRSDDSDVGELKRLVTVILQEVDEWPSSSLLLAATNFAELIDPALWRRFDLVLNFEKPNSESIKEAIKRFLGPDYAIFARWIDLLVIMFKDESFSNIERSINKFRRSVALGISSDEELIESFIKDGLSDLERNERIEIAVNLNRHSKLSQHAISDLTGVSRDTIRKYSSKKTNAA
ncbi:ATP-binding protein (plasmid) [Enterobacter hormaechei]|uniref:AAA family ATPase n=1 Tax=Enterobacteriaceae TaxID=543 RepID=UPI0005821207|nr:MULTISPECIES: ATP-binding protein [Enterobacteriaceae]ECF2613191.1 AAA family ATPase [Salmonella enterica subsp. enterica serovar Concord]HCJ6309464.1 AAA family ATPase [Enterobacter hormaechei subsp. xiangfangensis]HCT4439466.1 AAA family ATPase [Klebsiella aerogenes]AJB65018.1 ATPase [Enterobacter hormaechei subsp. steigerwaltii]ARJ98337.1 ATPase [Escherichia coli]